LYLPNKLILGSFWLGEAFSILLLSTISISTDVPRSPRMSEKPWRHQRSGAFLLSQDIPCNLSMSEFTLQGLLKEPQNLSY
jgi:hypothetical protein